MAGGPGGVQVGRVNIKVVPDFTHFRKLMNAVLKEYSARTVDVKVRADDSALDGLSRDLAATGRSASRAMSGEISKGLKKAGKDAKIAPALDSKTRFKKRMQADLNKVFDQIEVRLQLKGGNNADLRDFWDKELAQVQKQIGKLDVELDTRSFNAQAAYVLATLNKLRADSQKLREPSMQTAGGVGTADVDASTLRKNMIALNNEMQKSAGIARNLDAAFDNAFGFQKRQAIREYLYGFRDMNAEMINAGRKSNGSVALFGLEESIARVTNRVDRLRMGGGLIGGLLGGAGAIAGAKGMLELTADGIKNVGAAAVNGAKKLGGFMDNLQMPSFGTGVNLAGYAVILGAITLVAAPLIGLLTTAALTLPGLLATIMAPIGAVILGFGGIKKAAENAGLFGDKNGDKKGGGSLGAALKDLQKQVQDVFENTLTEPFKKLGAVANSWVAPLTTVAQGTADIFKGMLDSITSEIGSTRIAETMSAIGTELSRSFAPGVKSFSDALIGLAHEFTAGGALEGVGKWFKETMADFSAWVEKGKESGELTTIFGELGDVLRGLLEAAGGLAKSGLDFVKDPAAMEGFKNTLADITGLIERIGQISSQLGPVWDLLELILPNQKEYNSEMDKMIADFEKAKGLKPGAIEAMEAADKANRPKIFGGDGGEEKAAAEAGDSAAQAYMASVTAALANNQEAQKALLKQAFTADGISQAAAAQITAQAGVAITGVQQALTPLKEGLQTDINNALTPLGDIAGKVAAAFDGVPGLVQGSLGQVAGIVSTSLGGVKTAAETSMQGLSDAVIQHCAIAVNTATSEAPRIKAPFEALSGQMFQVGAQMMAGLSQGITGSVGFAEAAARAAAIRVKGAADEAAGIRSPSREFMKTGDYMMQGMKVGIENGTGGPMAAMREVMQAIKDVFGSAEGLNLNFFMGEAASSMSSMATSSKEFRSNMVEAGTSPAITSGLDAKTTDLADIKRQKAELDVRIAELQAQKNATTDKAAKAGLTAEIDQLRIQKERLDLLKEENGLQEDRKTAIQKLSDQIATNITDMIKMPGEFAKTTANAAMQDLGISGSGAIPTIANWAMDAGTNFIFNVNNMDDAIQGQQAQQNKQVAGVVSR